MSAFDSMPLEQQMETLKAKCREALADKDEQLETVKAKAKEVITDLKQQLENAQNATGASNVGGSGVSEERLEEIKTKARAAIEAKETEMEELKAKVRGALEQKNEEIEGLKTQLTNASNGNANAGNVSAEQVEELKERCRTAIAGKDNEIADLQSKVKTIVDEKSSRIAELELQVSGFDSEKTNLTAKIATTESERDAAVQEKRNIASQLASASSGAGAKDAEVSQLREEMETLKQKCRGALEAKDAEVEELKTKVRGVVEQKQIEIEELGKERSELVSELADAEQKSSNAAELRAQLATITDSRGTTLREVAELKQQAGESATAMEALKQRLAAQEALLAEKEEATSKLEKEVESVKAAKQAEASAAGELEIVKERCTAALEGKQLELEQLREKCRAALAAKEGEVEAKENEIAEIKEKVKTVVLHGVQQKNEEIEQLNRKLEESANSANADLQVEELKVKCRDAIEAKNEEVEEIKSKVKDALERKQAEIEILEAEIESFKTNCESEKSILTERIAELESAKSASPVAAVSQNNELVANHMAERLQKTEEELEVLKENAVSEFNKKLEAELMHFRKMAGELCGNNSAQTSMVSKGIVAESINVPNMENNASLDATTANALSEQNSALEAVPASFVGGGNDLMSAFGESKADTSANKTMDLSMSMDDSFGDFSKKGSFGDFSAPKLEMTNEKTDMLGFSPIDDASASAGFVQFSASKNDDVFDLM